VLADTEGLQASLYSEMRARIKEEDASSPVRWGRGGAAGTCGVLQGLWRIATTAGVTVIHSSGT
jgi:hypothetical protein